jgi:hypothetical protein
MLHCIGCVLSLACCLLSRLGSQNLSTDAQDEAEEALLQAKRKAEDELSELKPAAKRSHNKV